jgi:hypothetical protein
MALLSPIYPRAHGTIQLTSLSFSSGTRIGPFAGREGRPTGWSGKLAGADSSTSEVFTLLKCDGEWKITQKTCHWHDM